MLSLTVAQAGRRLWPLCVRPYCQSARLAATTAVNRPTDRSQSTGYRRTKAELMNQFETFLSHRQLEGDAGPSHPMVFNMMKLCGSGLIETPQTKVELAQHMWKAMKDSGLKSEVALYNLLLQVYLLNEYHFSPSKVIEEMKACDVSPNQGTLALILQGYCQQGKLDGATQVLEYMKALNHPINEHIYAALITGHSRAGDMAGLQQIIVSMEAKGLRPGAITFSAVLYAYAERGDMGAISDVFADMRQRRVFLNQAEYIKTMDTLSAHGHGHLIPRVMDYVRNKQWMQSALQDLACVCAVRGEFDSTMTILGCLNDPGSFSFSAVADAVLRSEGKTMEEKMAMLGRLEKSCYGASQHDAVMNYLLQQQQMKDAVAMVKDLHSKGLPVRMHYMYPVLAWYTREKDLKGFLETIQLIGDVGLDVRDEKIVFYCSRLSDSDRGDLDLHSERMRLAMLAESGARESQHDAVMDCFLQHKMDEAIPVIRDLHSKGLPVRMHYIYPVLAWYTREKDLKGLLETIQLVDDVGLDLRDDHIASFCNEALKRNGLGKMGKTTKWQQVEDVIAMMRALHSKGLPMRILYMYPVLAWYARERDLKGLTETIQLIADVGLDIHDGNIAAYCTVALKASSADELDKISEAFKAGTLPHPMAEALIQNTNENMNLQQLLDLAPVVSLNTLPKMLKAVSSAVKPDTTVSNLVKLYTTFNSRIPHLELEPSEPKTQHENQSGVLENSDSRALEPLLSESLESLKAAEDVALFDTLNPAIETPQSGLSEKLLGSLEALEVSQTGASELNLSDLALLEAPWNGTPETPHGRSLEVSQSFSLILELQNSVRNVVQLLCEQQREDVAKRLLVSLRKHGVAAGSEAYQELLQKYASWKTPDNFFYVLRGIKSQGLTLKPKHQALTLKMASNSGRYKTAAAAFAELPDPKYFNYDDFLITTAREKKATECWQLYSEMRAKDMTPSFFTYQALMIALLSKNELQRALSVKNDFLTGNFTNKERAVCHAFVVGYTSSGQLSEAEEEIKKIKEAGITPFDITYGKLAASYAHHGSPEPILELMKELEQRQDGTEIHRSMISALLRAYLKHGNTTEAVESLDQFKTALPYSRVLYTLAEVLVGKRDMEGLQKVLKVLETTVKQPLTTDDMLLYHHLKTGSVEEAQSLLQKSDFKPSEDYHYLARFSRICAAEKQPERLKAAIDMMQEQNKLCDSIVMTMLAAYVGDKGGPKSRNLRKTLPEELQSLLPEVTVSKETVPVSPPESSQESSESAA